MTQYFKKEKRGSGGGGGFSHFVVPPFDWSLMKAGLYLHCAKLDL